MDTRTIGSLEVSLVGLGGNNFGGRLDAKQTRAVVDAALDAGINFVDTADVYGATRSEEYLGEALEGRRDRVVLATKVGGPLGDEAGASPARVRRAAEASLRRLRTDRIDLYQLHRPDPNTPMVETAGGVCRAAARGQGHRDRLLELRAPALLREQRRCRQRRGRRPLRQRSEPLQPARPRRRGGGAPPLRRAGARLCALLSAGNRAAHRQVPPG